MPARTGPMHVLYLIDSLVPGGAERSLAALAPAYFSLGIRLEVAYLHNRPGLQEELRRAEVPLFGLAGPGGRRGWVRRARELIGDRRPDLVHTTLAEANLAGRIAARLAGTPVVSSIVNVQYGPEQAAPQGAAWWKVRGAFLADRATARLVARFHAITRYLADVMSEVLSIPRDRIDVVPRGRSAEDLGRRTGSRRTAARAALGIGGSAPLLVAVARQDRQKGLDLLLEAMPAVLAREPRATLVVAGREGNVSGELSALTARLGLEDTVRFLGTRHDVPELLCAADAFVFPSRWEGLGSVLLEAMALEVPIVASDIPPVREVVGKNGTAASLVPVGDPRSLGDAVADSLSDPSRASRRARSARKRFLERFTMGPVAAGMLAFYRRALNR